MFVCSCNMLTDTDVEAAVKNGAVRPREVYESKGCRAQCGNCVPGVVCLLRQMLRQGRMAVPEAMHAGTGMNAVV
ncbi:(2Fe-2S)-binding protein [Komagataeibacter rhaeticus]|mgnify:CR=1 FL=1|nr:(2Fe-2S)-binding protein [Komagataeibacter rhaeticus]KDU95886.1 bacterioferritin [Komagataeibacter rhaeticus AF1]MBL7240096.1 (2Fe-2S)-binding protein [Komagataeibacter rhaeticus]MDT8872826.1 (2Fe-2S)-binding protein [Komagataeibacter rhaeticus]QOC45809.1 (2Fe-2S)-binding protein [Komagataeibacter rhaeticus]WPP21522.1 (2Fe-2S)-binding protein [Komagataeibacter rhaeticus]